MISRESAAQIRRLYYAEHWKLGTIAAEVGLPWETVRRAVHIVAPPRATPGKRRVLTEPYIEFVRRTLEQYPKLRATRIHDMLRSRGYAGGVIQVRRLVSQLRPPARREAFLRLHTLPGEQAQVDWASFGTIRIGRAVRRLSAFVVVLSWSRAIWVEFFLDQTMESFLLGHVHAFEEFGGVPRAVLYDNLKSAVLGRHGEAVQLHPRLIDLASHYHFAPKPCHPYSPNEKGRVERSIQYVRHSFFAGRSFRSIDELNRDARIWRDDLAHQRRWVEDDERIVAQVFEEERDRLLPLPLHPFETDLLHPTRSGKTPFVRFDLNDYSIPPEAVGRSLTILASVSTIRILEGTIEIARHVRSFDRHATVEAPEHRDALLEQRRRGQLSTPRGRLAASTPDLDRFLAAAVERGETVHSSLRQLTRLLDDYGRAAFARAISLALERDTPRPSSVALLLETEARRSRAQTPLPVDLGRRPELAEIAIRSHDVETYDDLTRKNNDPGD